MPTDTQPQFELGDTAEDIERRIKERGEREQGKRQEQEEERERAEREERVETETLEQRKQRRQRKEGKRPGLDQFQQMRTMLSTFLGARPDPTPGPRQSFCNYLHSEIEHLDERDFLTFRNETVKLLNKIQ